MIVLTRQSISAIKSSSPEAGASHLNFTYLLFVSPVRSSGKHQTKNIQHEKHTDGYDDSNISCLSNTGKSEHNLINVHAVWFRKEVSSKRSQVIAQTLQSLVCRFWTRLRIKINATLINAPIDGLPQDWGGGGGNPTRIGILTSKTVP